MILLIWDRIVGTTGLSDWSEVSWLVSRKPCFEQASIQVPPASLSHCLTRSILSLYKIFKNQTFLVPFTKFVLAYY